MQLNRGSSNVNPYYRWYRLHRVLSCDPIVGGRQGRACEDRKSTRLNSSHANISYAVFCLKKKKKTKAKSSGHNTTHVLYVEPTLLRLQELVPIMGMSENVRQIGLQVGGSDVLDVVPVHIV